MSDEAGAGEVGPALLRRAVAPFLAAEAVVLEPPAEGSSARSAVPVDVAAIGTTAERAVKGELLARAIEAAGFVPGSAEARAGVDELLADRAWALGVVLSPWKRDIGVRCERLAPSAVATGVVDTLARTGAGVVGFNTNTWAAQTALEVLTGAVAPARLLVVGAGASARSVAAAVRRAWPETELVVAARSGSQAVAMAGEFGAGPATAGSAELRDGGFQVVVNATTWGETESSEQEPLGVDLSGILLPGVRLFDLNNRVGSLPTQALATGCVVQSGGLMQRVTNACRAALLSWL